MDWASLGAEMERLVRGEGISAAATQSGSAVVLDTAVLDEILETIGSPLLALIDGMIREARRLADVMAGAAGQSEVETVRRAAHSLKGLASQFGASRFAGRAARIEQAAIHGEKIEPFLPDVETTANEAFSALHRWCHEVERRGSSGTTAH